jgi:hypothetical protein
MTEEEAVGMTEEKAVGMTEEKAVGMTEEKAVGMTGGLAYATTLRRWPVISKVAGSMPMGSPSTSMSVVFSECASMRRAVL